MPILPDIMTLVQHLSHLRIQSEDYRPKCCPFCGKAGLWCHGHYHRKANRRSIEVETDEPILIPRFFCSNCAKSCAMLPEVIPPHRHYLWALQQVILLQILNGDSINAVAKRWPPTRKTISRWWRQLKGRFTADAACLRSHLAQLGRTQGFDEFWLSTLAQMPLSTAMLHIHASEVSMS
jgi:hypothetical protein